MVFLHQNGGLPWEKNLRFGKHADKVGAAFDFLVETFRRVPWTRFAPNVPGAARSTPKGLLTHHQVAWLNPLQDADHFGVVGVSALGFRLAKDGPDLGGHLFLPPRGQGGHSVAEEVEPDASCSATTGANWMAVFKLLRASETVS